MGLTDRQTIEAIESRFQSLHDRNLAAVDAVAEDLLFVQMPASLTCGSMRSFGEAVVRSAAAVEQTFGGITVRLWDDPFEWTLPEELATRAKVVEYLHEVEATRQTGFDSFASDADLFRSIPAPEKIRPILEVVLETLARAERLHGRAQLLAELLRDPKHQSS